MVPVRYRITVDVSMATGSNYFIYSRDVDCVITTIEVEDMLEKEGNVNNISFTSSREHKGFISFSVRRLLVIMPKPSPRFCFGKSKFWFFSKSRYDRSYILII
jgi:hypothetical protein